MIRKYYLCRTDHHNKFWQYEIDGNSVKFTWGRVGGTSDTTTTLCKNEADAQRLAERKANEKTRPRAHGTYVETDPKELAEEEAVADKLGAQYKILSTVWVAQDQRRLTVKPECAPGLFAYAKVQQSWNKEITHLLLNKTEAFELYDVIADGNALVYRSRRLAQANFAEGVRFALRRVLEAVATVLRRKMGDLGGRVLFADGPAQSTETMPVLDEQEVSSIAQETGVAREVVSSFGRLGRKLAIDF
jgi:predicted DNA-binding WGR domain protein